MRHFARTSLGWLGLALIAPITAVAQDMPSSAPAGYQPASAAVMNQSYTPAPAVLDGKPAPATAPEPAHKHNGRTVCARCAAKQGNAMPPGKIVGCAHSKNGVCTACQAALNMPGQFVTTVAPSAEAPGRAVASSSPSPSSGMGKAGAGMAYDTASGDPMPVGVVQAGYSQPGSMGMQAAPTAMPGAQPGRAVAESSPGRDPYQPRSSSFPHPHILGHLFGWSGIGAERAEAKARRKAETHAMISYDTNAPSAVEELPASVVYGKK